MNFSKLHRQSLYLLTAIIMITSNNINAAVFKPNPGQWGNKATATFSSLAVWEEPNNWFNVTEGKVSGFPGDDDEVQFGSSAQYGNNGIVITGFDLADEYTGITFNANSYPSVLTIGSGATVDASSLNENGNRITLTINSGGELTVHNTATFTANQTSIYNYGTISFNDGLNMVHTGKNTIVSSGDFNVTGQFKMLGTGLTVSGGSFDVSEEWVIETADGQSNNDLDVTNGASLNVGGIDFYQYAIGPEDIDITGGNVTVSGSCNHAAVCAEIEAQGGDLPVELISLFGIKTPEGFIVKWTTGSEINNSHFMIEASNTKNNWKEIAEIDGQGNSNVATDYEILLKGEQYNYYRLVQYDFDNSYEILGILTQNVLPENDTISIFPNELTQGQSTNLLFSNPDSDIAFTLYLFDLVGNEVDQQSASNYASSFYQYKVPNSLNKGYYILNVLIGSKRYQQKILVK